MAKAKVSLFLSCEKLLQHRSTWVVIKNWL